MAVTTLDAGINDTLNRLGDPASRVWSRDETALYLQDGYDQFCRRSKALFDVVAIENLPPVGNWTDDLSLYHAQQKPGFGFTDGPIHFTHDSARDFSVGGRVGGSLGPQAVGLTSPGQRSFAATHDVETSVVGGYLPQSTVEVLRVTYDNRDLLAMGSQQMRRLDATYESRDGDPQFFTYDKDGLFFLRVIPAAQGNAAYPDVNGSWGILTQTDDSTITVVTTEANGYNTGGYGLLRARSDAFPSGGPWGSPTRIHPDSMNIKAEVTRLGRDLATAPFEIPAAYVKYVVYWAMSRALRREGPGQDIALADHFEQRFEMGLYRIIHRRDRMAHERVGQLGFPAREEPFGLGAPKLSSFYPDYPW